MKKKSAIILSIATLFLLFVNCIDVEVDFTFNEDGSGKARTRFIKDMMFAGATGEELVSMDADEKRQYVKNGKYIEEYVKYFHSMKEMSDGSFYDKAKRLVVFDFGDVFSRDQDVQEMAFFLSDNTLTFRTIFPYDVAKAEKITMNGYDIYPVVEENSATWRMPMSLFVQCNTPWSLKVQLKRGFVVRYEYPQQPTVITKPDSHRVQKPPFAFFFAYPADIVKFIGPMMMKPWQCMEKKNFYNQNEPILFDATMSSDDDGEIAFYSWDFGDGGIGQGCKVEHIFSKSGEYNVVLTIADNDGLENTSERPVFVLSSENHIQQLKEAMDMIELKTGNHFRFGIYQSSKHAATAGDLFMKELGKDANQLIFNVLKMASSPPGVKEWGVLQNWAVQSIHSTGFDQAVNTLNDEQVGSIFADFSFGNYLEDVETRINIAGKEIRDVNEKTLTTINTLDEQAAKLYVEDLRKREYGNFIMINFFNSQANLPYFLGEIKLTDEESWTLKVGNFLYDCSVSLLVNALDHAGAAPVTKIVSKTISTLEKVRSLHYNVKAATLDMEMLLLSHQTFSNSCFNDSDFFGFNILRAVKNNTSRGYEIIVNQQTPQLIKGTLEPIKFKRKKCYITIQNPNNFTAAYKLIVKSTKTFASFELGPKIGRYYDIETPIVYPAGEEWIKIKKHKKGTIKIKLADKSDYVYVDLLGKTDTGIYGVDYEMAYH